MKPRRWVTVYVATGGVLLVEGSNQPEPPLSKPMKLRIYSLGEDTVLVNRWQSFLAAELRKLAF